MRTVLTLLIGMAVSAPAQAGQYWYLLSNATGWALNEDTLLTPYDQGSDAIEVDVDQTWITRDTSGCFIVNTDVPGDWTTAVRYGLEADGESAHELEVGQYSELNDAGSAPLFVIDYGHMGTYRIRIGDKEGVWILVEPVCRVDP